jgi:hypothetical protein
MPVVISSSLLMISFLDCQLTISTSKSLSIQFEGSHHHQGETGKELLQGSIFRGGSGHVPVIVG